MVKNMITKKDIRIILLIFLLSRIPLLLFLILSKNLNVYDSIHYLEIAKNGYSKELLYAFFPLFPLTIKILHIIIPSYYISGIILSNIFSLLATLVLYLIIDKKDYKIPIIILFIFSPILGYTSIAYTESLFLLLSLLAYYFYKKNNLLLCSVIIGLTMLTRNSGIILLGALGLSLLIKWLKKQISLKDIIVFSLPAILIGSLFPIYLYLKTGNPFIYITIQNDNWHRIPSNIISSFINDISYMIKTKDIYLLYIFIQNWLFFFIAGFFAIKTIKKQFPLSIYVLVSLIAFTITCRDSNWNTLPTISLFRYVFGLFPIYLYIYENNKKTVFKYISYTLVITISIVNTLLIYSGLFIG